MITYKRTVPLTLVKLREKELFHVTCGDDLCEPICIVFGVDDQSEEKIDSEVGKHAKTAKEELQTSDL